MAGRLMASWTVFLALGAALCVAPAAVSAQAKTPAPQAALADPTRPPASFLEPEDSGEAAGGRVLQSVLIPRQGKPLAVIDGQSVRLGQRFGEARLIRVSEREAVLEGPEGIERLQLTPGIEKTNNRPVNVTNGAQSAPARRPARNER